MLVVIAETGTHSAAANRAYPGVACALRLRHRRGLHNPPGSAEVAARHFGITAGVSNPEMVLAYENLPDHIKTQIARPARPP